MPADATTTEPLCPHCLETVNPEATRCRHCGSDLGTKPDQSSTTVTYIVDRGLIRYGKFALGVLAIFVVFGTYVFGFDISNLVKEMRTLEAQIRKETTNVDVALTKLDKAVEELGTSQASIETAKAELDKTRKALEQSKAALAKIETQTQEVSQRTKIHLVTIEAHLTRAGFLVASIEERHEQSLTSEQEAVAEEARRELSETTGSVTPRDGKLWPVGHRLTVGFLEGSDEQRALVQEAVKEWETYANITFDFISDARNAEIRIAFRRGDGAWSYVGTDALALPQHLPTLNFGFDLTTPNGHDMILSEFGHALGLLNEHQNPTDPIPWNKEAVIEYYSGAPLHWSRDLIEHNILRRASADDYPGERPFDPNSIMMYSFPAGLSDSDEYRAGLSPAPGLSESDKIYIADLYPHDQTPGAAAGIVPSTPTARSEDTVTGTARLQRILDEGQCIGCGLCASLFPNKLSMAVAPETGNLRPEARAALSGDEADAIYAVCPGVVQAGLPDELVADEAQVDAVWGPVVRLDRGHASDPAARFKAATGGALTALCDYLLASGTARAILHVKAGGAGPAYGTTQVSNDRAGVLEGAGSRYGPSAPLAALHAMLDRGEPFALVAKPCDLSAVRLLGRSDPRVGDLITHMLTPVCGGFMPAFGMDAFLRRNGVDPDEVTAISYRGEGCPGPTRAVLKDGRRVDRTYLDIWGTDSSTWQLPWRCKICPDGTGEAADVAAADTWPGGSPTEDMLEGDPGTNAIIARTAAGATLVAEAADAGFLTLEGPATTDDLSLWQPHQVRKKLASGARFEGLRKAGHLGLETVGLRTQDLRARMAEDDDRQQVEGTVARIAIGKHRDDFGMES